MLYDINTIADYARIILAIGSTFFLKNLTQSTINYKFCFRCFHLHPIRSFILTTNILRLAGLQCSVHGCLFTSLNIYTRGLGLWVSECASDATCKGFF